MTSTVKNETTIPFAGFYESIHSSNIDSAIEFLAQDTDGDLETLYDADGEEVNLFDHVDYRKVEHKYCEEYVEDFRREFKTDTGIDLKIKFSVLESPREYNFTTDRIFVKIGRAVRRELFKVVDREALDKRIHEKFTSRDGFMSYYDNSLEAWGTTQKALESWDHNQVGTLLEQVLVTSQASYKSDDRTLNDFENNLVEEYRYNGYLDNWVYEALDDEGKAAVKAHDEKRRQAEYFEEHQLASPFASEEQVSK
jgi:hypothetical protein